MNSSIEMNQLKDEIEMVNRKIQASNNINNINNINHINHNVNNNTNKFYKNI